MKTLFRFLILAALAALLTGCEQPKIDASSDEALSDSIAEVRASLPADQQDKFDGLIAAQSLGGMISSAFTSGTVSIAAVMQPYDGLTGPEFIAKAEAKQAAKEAENRAENLAKLAELEQRQAAFEAEQLKLAKLVVENPRLVHNKNSFMSSADLLATITNNLSIPIAEIKIDYSLKSPDRAVPWDKGEGWFFIDGGLEPGETRDLDATSGGLSMNGFLALHQVSQEHPEAEIRIEITDAQGADEESILNAKALDSYEQSELGKLREEYPAE